MNLLTFATGTITREMAHSAGAIAGIVLVFLIVLIVAWMINSSFVFIGVKIVGGDNSFFSCMLRNAAATFLSLLVIPFIYIFYPQILNQDATLVNLIPAAINLLILALVLSIASDLSIFRSLIAAFLSLVIQIGFAILIAISVPLLMTKLEQARQTAIEKLNAQEKSSTKERSSRKKRSSQKRKSSKTNSNKRSYSY